ncbi:helix-turn-helix domain-containing protein [Cesiribacter andamanensis]|uniref:Putative transcription regulator containing HTH domain protein n=1 Tax=Cesiribacter andamanensis AMV16 TaxID=1279009 RepID=M7NQN8_9BACT|nr:helix-turn-helix transcriptional regulator [Cesiribacter andamanensis]EMR00804.1 putative transcription regulator containing HTH domain protein [Cesiribacter andamanensis AMV16]
MISREELYQTPEYWLERIQNDIFRMVHVYMEERGLNQTALARELGVSKGYISQIVNGNFNFSLTKLIELSLALGVAPKVNLQESVAAYSQHQEKKLDYMQNNGFVSVQLNAAISPYPMEVALESSSFDALQIA